MIHVKNEKLDMIHVKHEKYIQMYTLPILTHVPSMSQEQKSSLTQQSLIQTFLV